MRSTLEACKEVSLRRCDWLGHWPLMICSVTFLLCRGGVRIVKLSVFSYAKLFLVTGPYPEAPRVPISLPCKDTLKEQDKWPEGKIWGPPGQIPSAQLGSEGVCNPKAGGRSRQIPGSQWAACLPKSENCMFSERPVFKNKTMNPGERYLNSISSLNTQYIHAYTHLHTYILENIFVLQTSIVSKYIEI